MLICYVDMVLQLSSMRTELYSDPEVDESHLNWVQVIRRMPHTAYVASTASAKSTASGKVGKNNAT